MSDAGCFVRLLVYTLAAPAFAVYLMILGVVFVIRLFIEMFNREVERHGIDSSQ